MDSSNEEQAQIAKKSPNIVQRERAKNNSPASKCNGLLPVLSLIIALGALGTALYTSLINQQLRNNLNHENTNFSAQIKEVEQKQDQAQEQLNARINSAEEIHTQLQTKLENLNKQINSTLNQKFYQAQDWLLLKARYFLELAQINAHWSNNTDSIIALLGQADQLLKKFNDTKIYSIRQAIANDIAQIKAIPSVDIAGILSQLDAAQNSINDLSIPVPLSSNELSTDNTTTSTNTPPTWRVRLQDSINLFEKLVVIRHHDKNIKPIISPLLETLLKENLHLNLQEAQWAVLNHESFVYQLALKQAIQSLKTNFNESATNTAALIQNLTQLQQINVAPKRPVIGSALPMLNELIDANKAHMNQSQSSDQGGKQ